MTCQELREATGGGGEVGGRKTLCNGVILRPGLVGSIVGMVQLRGGRGRGHEADERAAGCILNLLEDPFSSVSLLVKAGALEALAVLCGRRHSPSTCQPSSEMVANWTRPS